MASWDTLYEFMARQTCAAFPGRCEVVIKVGVLNETCEMHDDELLLLQWFFPCCSIC